MSISRITLLAIILIVFSTGGCLMRRTITQGDNVVAEGYVVKPPLAPFAQ